MSYLFQINVMMLCYFLVAVDVSSTDKESQDSTLFQLRLCLKLLPSIETDGTNITTLVVPSEFC